MRIFPATISHLMLPNRNTAMLRLGTNPGMKIVRFHSQKKAASYFVLEYMAGHVGVPVVMLEGSE